MHETPQHEDDGEYPSIRTADVQRGKIDLIGAKRVTESEYLNRIQRLEPKANDVVYTREGERFGLAAVVPPGVKLCLGQRMMMFRVNKKVEPSFLAWTLNGAFAYHYLKQSVAGATSPHLNISDIRNVPVLLPSLSEQAEIVGEIQRRFEIKEHLVGTVSGTITRLREYRSALITAAVTGQIDPATHARAGTTDRQLDALQSTGAP